MRFSSLAAHATIRIANKTDVTALQAAIPIEGKHATVLATVQGETASRRPFGRPGRLLPAAAATALVGTEEWCRLRSNRGMTDRVPRNARSIFPCPHREVRGRRWSVAGTFRSSGRRVRLRLPVHEKEFVIFDEIASFPDRQWPATSVALPRLAHRDAVDRDGAPVSANGLSGKRQHALQHRNASWQIAVRSR